MRFLGPASKDVEPNTFKRLPSIELVESAENPANCSVTATDKDTVPLQDSHRYGGFGGLGLWVSETLSPQANQQLSIP